MKTIKKFAIYFVLFILLYLVLDFLVFGYTKTLYKKEIEYEILVDNPKVIVTDIKSGYSNGYIKGNVTNTTGELINQTYLKIELYNSKGKCLGTKYNEIKYFNVNENISFDVEYNCTGIELAKISFANEVPEDLEIAETIETVEKWWPIAGILTVLYLLP